MWQTIFKMMQKSEAKLSEEIMNSSINTNDPESESEIKPILKTREVLGGENSIQMYKRKTGQVRLTSLLVIMLYL